MSAMLFIQNKYTRWYFSIISNAKSRTIEGYCEIHHIIPRSLGGNDSNENLVSLTAREHFICHMLLVKMTQDSAYHKMLHAAIIMKAQNNKQMRHFNSRLYEIIKNDYSSYKSDAMKGENNLFYGKTHSDSTRKHMSEIKKLTYSNGKHPHIGMKRGETSKNKISESKKHSRHWTNGIEDKTTKECPGEGWYIGRKSRSNYKFSDERKREIKELYSSGKMNWWNDGTKNQRCSECPGKDWKRGRLSYSKIRKNN